MQRLTTLLVIVSLASPPALADTYYASPQGASGGDGSRQDPWSISHALAQLGGGDTLLVMDGTYQGGFATGRAFDDWVTIRAENSYRAKLTNVDAGAQAVFIYTQGPARIIIDGFVISNKHPSHVCQGRESEYLVHIQDAQDIVLRNNIIYGNNAPGTCNELIKINRGGDPQYPKNISITGNVIYDHADAGGADMIDSVRPGELDITENIFFALDADQAQSFITLKRQVDAGSLGIVPRSPRYNISRNVYLNWHGKTDQAFIQLGEDGYAEVMISDALIENNLIIGNSQRDIAAPFQLKGVRDVTVRANTVVGDLPGGAYGFRIGTEENNLQVRDIFVYNNVFCDPTGSMGNRLINTYGDVDIYTIELDNNLYFNAGNPLPTTESPAPADDVNRVEGDPQIPGNHGAIELPVWDEANNRFPSGSTTIRQEFERLVTTYGAIGDSGAARNSAYSENMPYVDILGKIRGAQPDIGAFELIEDTPDGGDDDGDAGGADNGQVMTDDGQTLTDQGDGHDASGTDEQNGSDSNGKPVGECGCGGGEKNIPGVLILLFLLLLLRSAFARTGRP